MFAKCILHSAYDLKRAVFHHLVVFEMFRATSYNNLLTSHHLKIVLIYTKKRMFKIVYFYKISQPGICNISRNTSIFGLIGY